jgi:hypothetical protein
MAEWLVHCGITTAAMESTTCTGFRFTTCWNNMASSRAW